MLKKLLDLLFNREDDQECPLCGSIMESGWNCYQCLNASCALNDAWWSTSELEYLKEHPRALRTHMMEDLVRE